MSLPATGCDVDIIDDPFSLADLLSTFTNLPATPPSLYIDLKLAGFGDDKSISILTLLVRPINKIFIIDIFVLGEPAFNTAATDDNSTTLKSILESAHIPKVFFHVRQAAEALYAQFEVVLGCIFEVHQLGFAARKEGFDREEKKAHPLPTLRTCVEKDITWLSAELKDVWLHNDTYFDTLLVQDNVKRAGGFEARDFPTWILDCCCHSVWILLALYDEYLAMFDDLEPGLWLAMAQRASGEEVASARAVVQVRRCVAEKEQQLDQDLARMMRSLGKSKGLPDAS